MLMLFCTTFKGAGSLAAFWWKVVISLTIVRCKSTRKINKTFITEPISYHIFLCTIEKKSRTILLCPFSAFRLCPNALRFNQFWAMLVYRCSCLFNFRNKSSTPKRFVTGVYSPRLTRQTVNSFPFRFQLRQKSSVEQQQQQQLCFVH